MKSRRRIAFTKAQDCADLGCNYSRDLRPVEWASIIILRSSNLGRSTSEPGHLLPRRSLAGAAERPPTPDTKVDGRRGRKGPLATEVRCRKFGTLGIGWCVNFSSERRAIWGRLQTEKTALPGRWCSGCEARQPRPASFGQPERRGLPNDV